MLFSIITSSKSKMWCQVSKIWSFLSVTVFGCVSYELSRKVDKETGGMRNTLKVTQLGIFCGASIELHCHCYTHTNVMAIESLRLTCQKCRQKKVCTYIHTYVRTYVRTYVYICVLHTTFITYTAIILHEALLICPSFSLHICKQRGQWRPTQTTDNGIKKQKYIHTPDCRTDLQNKHCRFSNILKIEKQVTWNSVYALAFTYSQNLLNINKMFINTER